MQFLGLASFGLPELASGDPVRSNPQLGYRGGLAYSLATAPCSKHLYYPAREAASAMCAHDQINSCQLSSTIFFSPGYLGTSSGSTSTTATPLPPGSHILPHHRLRTLSGLCGTSTMVRSYQPLLFAMQFRGLGSFSLPELASGGPDKTISGAGAANTPSVNWRHFESMVPIMEEVYVEPMSECYREEGTGQDEVEKFIYSDIREVGTEDLERCGSSTSDLCGRQAETTDSTET
ncbi:hypothetical protein MRX96_010269 [Rhipicephalus microplus]